MFRESAHVRRREPESGMAPACARARAVVDAPAGGEGQSDRYDDLCPASSEKARMR